MKLKSVCKLRPLLCLGLVFVIVFLYKNSMAYGASPVTVNTVDYKEENIIVNNNGNQKIYFATENDAARGVWDVIPADSPDGSGTTTIDFSWVSPTNDQIIMIRGEDINLPPSRVILKARAKRLEVSINYEKLSSLSKNDTIASLLNIMSTEGTAANPIKYSDLEWRKGSSGSWRDTSALTVAQLEKLQIRGADLYFRIKAVNDVTVGGKSPDGTNGRRVSSEVRLKITAQTTPASVNVDGEKFTVQLKYGKEYRISYGSYQSGWIRITNKSTKEVDLKEMVNNQYNGLTASTKFPKMKIEVRDFATTSKPASKIVEININEQKTLSGMFVGGDAPQNPSQSDTNIYLAYNGSSAVTITIAAASSSNPYQYCIIKPGETFDLKKTTWYTVTKNSGFKLLSSRVPEGSIIYVRKRASKDTKTSTVELATTCLSHVVSYPAVPVVEAKNFTFIKGSTENLTFNIKMNTAGKLPFETKITSITYGSNVLDFICTPSEIVPTNPNIEYTMTVTLNANILNNLPISYSRALVITFGNGTVDKNSVKLAIQNPAAASPLTTSVTKGKTSGTTSIKVLNSVRSGHILVYKITDSKIDNVTTETVVADGITFVQEGDIAVTAGKYVTVYEINASTKKVSRYSSIRITANQIN